MNPHQKNKVDVKSLSPEEQRLFRLYGKLPSRSDHFAKHLKERKYFDSGDYAMSKAGKGDGVDAGAVGSQHPVPEDIPHLSSPVSNVNSNTSASSTASANTTTVPGAVAPAGPGSNIPKHSQHGSISGIQAGSPIKEGGSILQRETSAYDVEEGEKKENTEPLSSDNGIPIRR